MRLALLLLVLAHAAHAATVTEYGTMGFQIGEQMNFDAWLFETTFDHPVLLDGLPLSNFSMRRNQAFDMPESMVAQFGTAQLVCNCPSDCSATPGCDTTQCIWGSQPPAMASQQGAPDYAIPFPAVDEPVFSLFSTFAGADVPNLVPAPNKFILGKITADREPHHPGKHSGSEEGVTELVPVGLLPSHCRVVFISDRLQSNGASLNNTQGPLAVPRTTECDYAQFDQELSDLFAAIRNLDSAENTREGFEKSSWLIGAYLSRDNFAACRKLVDSLTLEGTVARTVYGDRECRQVHNSAAWLADPCCNPVKAYTHCCMPQPRVITDKVIAGPNLAAVAAQCQKPEVVAVALREYARAVRDEDLCESQSKRGGGNVDMWDSMTRFVQQCHEEVFGTTSAPTCRVDDDCWTEECKDGFCVRPYDNPDKPLIDCMLANINPRLEKTWRLLWNIDATAPRSEFDTEFRTRLFAPGCIGPTAWEFDDKWTSEVVPDCNGVQGDCWCYQTIDEAATAAGQNTTIETKQRCERGYMKAANQSLCVADTRCNWNPWGNQEVNCTGPLLSANFCAQCEGPECWERSEAAMCSTYVNSTDCTAVGGQQGRWGDWHCTFPDLNSTMCTGDKYYYPGQFTQQSECDAGSCNVDHSLNATECAKRGRCSLPCPKCFSRRYGSRASCLNDQLTLGGCNSAGGHWVFDSAVCSLESADQASCEAAGFTFFKCDSMAVGQCDACTSAMCKAAECYADRWQPCPDEATCEAAGMCDDWEYENWQNFGAGGVCITPFDPSNGGGHNCQPPKGWARTGCIDYNANSEGACSSGTWKTRAFTEAACDAHGETCEDDEFWGISGKSAAECLKCKGTMKKTFTWRTGLWSGAQMIPLTWKTRAQETVNSWVQNTLNDTALWSSVGNAVGYQMSEKTKTRFFCKHSVKSAAVRTAACLCTPDAQDRTCTTEDLYPLGGIRAYAGLETKAEMGFATIRMPPGEESTDIEVFVDGGGRIAGTAAAPGSGRQLFAIRSMASADPVDPYRVIVDSNTSEVIGQRTSSGVNVGLNGTVELCIAPDALIPTDPLYIIPVIAVDENGTIIVFLQDPPTDAGGLLCANVTNGTYYSGLIEDPLATPPPPPPPTAETTPLSDGAIAGIVLGSVAALVLLLLLIGISLQTDPAAMGEGRYPPRAPAPAAAAQYRPVDRRTRSTLGYERLLED